MSGQQQALAALELHGLTEWLAEWTADKSPCDILTRDELRKLRRLAQLLELQQQRKQT